MIRSWSVIIVLIILPVLSNLAQDDLKKLIKSKADSAWDHLAMGENLPEARAIADELFELAKDDPTGLAEINACQIIGETYYYSPHQDSAVIWYQRAFNIAREKKNEREMAHSSMSLGSIKAEINDYDGALEDFNFTLKVWKKEADTSNIIYALTKRAWLNNMADKHNLAMQDYIETIRYCRESRDSTDLGYALNGMGVILKKQENYQEAIDVFNESIEIQRALKDEFGMAAAQGNRALVYKSIGRYEEAYQPFVDQVDLYSSVNFTQGVMSCYANMTVISNLMGEHERAIKEAEQAIELSREVARPNTEADMHNEIARAYLALANPQAALEAGLKAKELADSGFYLEKQRDIEETLSQVYMALGDADSALQHYKLFTARKDSIFEKDKSNTVLELQTMYETAKKEQTIHQLESEKEIERFRNRALIAGLIVVILAAIIIINREVKRRKQARELHRLELETERLEKARLEDQLEFKNRELTAQALHIAQKNEMLQTIKKELESYRSENEDEGQVKRMVQKINFDKQFDKNWEQFIMAFKESNPEFLNELAREYPELTANEVRLSALIKMNIQNKDIAHILNISDDGVKKARYRLRKKLNMESSESLEAVIRDIGSSVTV